MVDPTLEQARLVVNAYMDVGEYPAAPELEAAGAWLGNLLDMATCAPLTQNHADEVTRGMRRIGFQDSEITDVLRWYADENCDNPAHREIHAAQGAPWRPPSC